MTKNQKNNKDINSLKKFATICWLIDKNGNLIESYVNSNGTNVFAIIDIDRNKIVLEIGLKGSTPYNRHHNSKIGVEIPKRVKNAELTERQYCKIGPKIWRQLQEIGSINLSSRKNDQIFYKTVGSNKNFKCNPRIKFVFDNRDVLLINDIFFSEMFLNQTFQKRISTIKSTITRKIKKQKQIPEEIFFHIFFPDFTNHGYKLTPMHILKHFILSGQSLAKIHQDFLQLLIKQQINIKELDQKILKAQIAFKQIPNDLQIRIYNQDENHTKIEMFLSPQ